MQDENSLARKLLRVQTNLKCPKSAWNSFSKYFYRSTEDILEALKPMLEEESLFLLIDYEPIMVDSWHYAKCTVAITDGEQTIAAHGYAREPEAKKGADESQITGMAFSYAAKRALGNLFLIDDTKDADDDGAQKPQQRQQQRQQQPQQRPQPQKINDEQWSKFMALFEKVAQGKDRDALWFAMSGNVGFQPSKDMTVPMCAAAVKWLHSQE